MSSTSAHQQALADAGSETRPPMLEKVPYQMKMIQPNPDAPPRLQNEDDLTGDHLKQYEADIEAMNLVLIPITNNIYNFVDACQIARDMWDRVKRLMHGTELSDTDRESRFNYEFDQFIVEAEESLMSPEWYKYVTNVYLAKNMKDDPYDMLFDHLHQYKKLVIASKAKKAANTHDPLADTFSDDQEDNLTSTMMLLARAITQRYSTLINNRLRTSLNTRNQAIVQVDRVNIQSRKVVNGGRIARRSSNTQEESADSTNVQKQTRNVHRTLRTSSSRNATNVKCYNCNAKGHYAQDCLKLRVWDSKYFMEQMLLAKKDEAGVILSNERNDFLLVDVAQMDEIEELSANICMMARIQQANTDSDEGPSYDYAFISEFGLRNPYTLKKAISTNPKLYDASYLHSSNVRANVCDTGETIEDATKIELSLEQKYFSEASTSTVTPTYVSKSSSPPLTMPKSSKMIKHFHMLKNKINKLHALLKAKTAIKSIFFKSREDTILSRLCYDVVKPILDYLHTIFKAIQKEFPEDVREMTNVFYSMESDLDATLRQNEILKDRLLEATLTHDVEKYMLMCYDSMNDNLKDEIEKVKRESIDVHENLLKRIKILENDFQRCQAQNINFELQLQHQKEKMNSFGWLLEEIRVTWAHLEKKWTRQQLYTNSLEEYANSGRRRCQDFQETVSRVICDGVKSYTPRCQDFTKVSRFWRHRQDEPT
ncbi:integrase, catalytic region, zinc finger, CCHC-type containing protein [Tanacetum coccineum]